MVEPMGGEESREGPVVICSSEGKPVDCAVMDDKAFRKTLENGTLWTVRPESGKVLPYRDQNLDCTVTAEQGWYRAVLRQETGSISGSGIDTEPEREPERGTPGNTEPGHDPGETGSLTVIGRLVRIIKERRQTMPEGSYTTYLFRQGSSKIRKKTGEEAVELILAEDSEQLAGEAADLLYHLLVLLEDQGVELRQVLTVLEERA